MVLLDILSQKKSQSAALRVQDFMGDIRTGQAVDYNSLATVLCQRAQGSDDAIQLTCMRWLQELVAVAKPQLKEQYADILAAVLPSLSHSRPDIASVCELCKLLLACS